MYDTYSRYIYISIHALRGEGDESRLDYPLTRFISIHALRGEGDGFSTAIELDDNNFNPRPPWGGRLVRPCDF